MNRPGKSYKTDYESSPYPGKISPLSTSAFGSRGKPLKVGKDNLRGNWPIQGRKHYTHKQPVSDMIVPIPKMFKSFSNELSPPAPNTCLSPLAKEGTKTPSSERRKVYTTSPNEGQEVSYEKLLDGATKPDATTKGDKSTLIAKQEKTRSVPQGKNLNTTGALPARTEQKRGGNEMILRQLEVTMISAHRKNSDSPVVTNNSTTKNMIPKEDPKRETVQSSKIPRLLNPHPQQQAHQSVQSPNSKPEPEIRYSGFYLQKSDYQVIQELLNTWSSISEEEFKVIGPNKYNYGVNLDEKEEPVTEISSSPLMTNVNPSRPTVVGINEIAKESKIFMKLGMLYSHRGIIRPVYSVIPANEGYFCSAESLSNYKPFKKALCRNTYRRKAYRY